MERGSDNKSFTGVIIPAAGQGTRFGGKKQFKSFDNTKLLTHVITVFSQSEFISEIVVVVPKNYVEKIQAQMQGTSEKIKVSFVSGGKRRQDSVFNGMNALPEKCNLVCIHDAVRPFITVSMIEKTINACEQYDGAIIAVPAKDTLKKVKIGRIQSTVNRNEIWHAQTPQTFQRKKLENALQSAKKEGITGSDEAFLLERLGYNVAVVEGTFDNLKITTPDDWRTAEAMWKIRHG